MLTLDPKERITIPQIKQHPWYLGVEDTPRQTEDSLESYSITLPEIDYHSDVISNLKLLGWEQSELMNELLDKKMNMAKAFFKLLVEQKGLPAVKDTPHNIDKKVFRRRSIGAETFARIGVTHDTTKSPKNKIKIADNQRAIQRSSQRLTVVTRTNSNNSSAESLTKSSTEKDKDKGKTSPTNTSPKSSKAVIWGITGSEPKHQPHHNMESTKSVTQILEALKHCFADLGQYDLSAKQTKNGGLKVKARKSGGRRHGPPVVTVSLSHSVGEERQMIRGRKSSSTKKVEET